MHDLKNPYELVADAAPHLVARQQADDLVGDLAELQLLVADLALTAGARTDRGDAANFSEGWIEQSFDQGVQILRSRLRKLTDLFARTKGLIDSRDFMAESLTARREYLSMKTTLRLAYRQKGLLMCAADWQSPMYEASVDVEPNRLSDGIAEHSWDYKRDGHLDALAYEQQFLDEYCAHLGSPRLRAYLTNSGMAAFSTVMHWLCQERDIRGAALAITPMYFENIHLAQRFLPDLVTIDNPSTEDLLNKLRELTPGIVICDAVTNCGSILAHDINAILEWCKLEAKHEVAVVIDTTCFPTLLLSESLLEDMPSNVTVVFVESLAKYHQFGMDAVTGGIFITDAADVHHDSLRKTRARFGGNISDASVRSLPSPHRSGLLSRMRRHARNADLFIDALQQQLQLIGKQTVISSIESLGNTIDSCPWYQSSCLVLMLDEQYRSISTYRILERRVLELAKQRGLTVGMGTSFGFDVTRLYVTAPSTPFEPPFLRISIGTETAEEIRQLAEVVAIAADELRATEEPAAPTPCLPAQPMPTPTKLMRDRSQLQRSVYVGASALATFLSPENYSPAPMVELPDDLNHFRQRGVRIFAKLMPFVPLMNIKSLPAFSMLNEAMKRGDLDGVKSVIESSSSNTVLSLSIIARLFGIDMTTAIVDHSIAPSLVRMLRLFGIDILMHPAAGHPLFGIMEPRSERATNIGAQDGWYNPGQYSNPDNPTAFANWLAPDILEQTQGRLEILSCGLGTCGTMVGVARGLRAAKPEITIVSCCPVAGEAVPGPRELSLLKDVTFDWKETADARIELGAKESFEASVRLLRRGLMAGPSSGMNYAGLIQYLHQLDAAGELERRLLATGGDLWTSFLCCDSPLPHVDEYFDALGDDFFPRVQPVEGDPS